MASLSAFLHPEQAENKEVIVSERFKENGNTVPFVIRPITQRENEELLKKHRKVDKQGVEVFNRVLYINRPCSSRAGFKQCRAPESIWYVRRIQNTVCYVVCWRIRGSDGGSHGTVRA